MPIFEYTVSTKDGKIKKGKLEVGDKSEAITQLLNEGFLIIALKESKKKMWPSLSLKRVSEIEKIHLVKNMSLMIKSGLPLIEIFGTLIEQAKSRKLKNVLKEIKEKVSQGSSLYTALSFHPEIFSPLFLGLIKLGEESGQLEKTTSHLHHLLLSQYEFKKKIKSALIYPTMIIITTIIVFLSFFIFLLPRLSKLFAQIEIKLPLITRIFIRIADFFQKNSVFIFLIVLFMILIFWLLSRKKETRKFLQKLQFSLPFIGKILREISLSQFSKNLGLLLKSGMPIEKALLLSFEITQNEVYKEKIIKIVEGIRRGEKIATNLEKFPKDFPKNFSKIIESGERSGNLVEALDYLSSFYETDIERETKDLTIAFEPLLLIIVGLLVAFIALAIISPIYQYISALGEI
ncbi:MAG: type II secretion system F family protein [Patescibacteria group bacterium]